MNVKDALRFVVGTVAAVVCIAAGVSGQSSAPAADPVVAEIRALRVDLNQRLDATIRAQLMIGRLSLQEQRVTTVMRQLESVQSKLRDNATARLSTEAGLKMLGIDKMTEKEKEEAPMVAPFKAGMEALEKSDAELKLQLSELQNLLAQEQARWHGFNRLLDDLEASLSKPVR